MTRDDLKKFTLPDTPGIYQFRDERNILYIGKAASLADRVRSYFATDLGDTRSPAIVGMVQKATKLTWITTDSVLEALILEANLIKKIQPPYNVDQKDNKSWNYVVVTKEPFPRIHTARGRELFDPQTKTGAEKSKAIFGPFVHGGSLKEALKLIRKIFPYRDTCMPESGRPCFNRQIGLCPGVCTGEVGQKEYAQTIRNITELFSGKMGSLRRRLEREMKEAARREDFEVAEQLRRQVQSLAHIRDTSLIKDEYRASTGGAFRIEAFDVAHTSGRETVGVMVVVSGGEPDKGQYRKFNIKTAANDDNASLSEVLERRLAHPEWPLPRLIVVDGGSAQVRTTERVLRAAGVGIPVAGVVKDEFHRPKRLIGAISKAHEKDILLANAEAHRFAIGFHRAKRQKSMIE